MKRVLCLALLFLLLLSLTACTPNAEPPADAGYTVYAVTRAEEFAMTLLDTDISADCLYLLGGGDVAAFATRLREKTPGVAAIRTDNGNLRVEPLAEVYNPATAAYPGDKTYDFYMSRYAAENTLEAGVRICGYSVAALGETTVFDTAGLGYTGALEAVYPHGGGYYVAAGGEATALLLRFEPTEARKRLLVVGRMESNRAVTQTLQDFNAQSRSHYAISRHYFDPEDSAENQLNLDIASGNAPDVLSVMGSTYELYAARGLFVDMNPLLESDTELSRAALLPNVLDALAWPDGALYQLCPYFALSSCCVHQNVWGDAAGWTLADLYETCARYPEMTLFGALRGVWLLDLLLCDSFAGFADIPNGVYSFDSPEFIAFLEFMREMDARARTYTQGADDYAQGRILLCPLTFQSMADYKAFVKNQSLAEMRVVGFPTDAGTGSHITAPVRFSIFAGTGNEEAAWDFIKSTLALERQLEAPGLPVRTAALEQLLEEAKAPSPATAETRYDDPLATAAGYEVGTSTVALPELPGLTEEELLRFRDLLAQADSVYLDSAVSPYLAILTEECGALFAGDKNAEDTAKLIQSRLRIYFAERE